MIVKISHRFFDDLRVAHAGDAAAAGLVKALAYCSRYSIRSAVVPARLFDRFCEHGAAVRAALLESGLAVAADDDRGREALALQGRGELWDLQDSGGVPHALRRNVLQRDKACVYCGSTVHLTVDHVVPRSKGGGHTLDNLVAACKQCNSSKSNRTPEQWAANAPARKGLQ